MSATSDTSVRPTAVYDLPAGSLVRGQNFWVQWLEAGLVESEVHSAHEMLLLLPSEVGAQALIGSSVHDFPGRSVCILPAGRVAITLNGTGKAALITSSRGDAAEAAVVNGGDYATPDSRIRPSEDGYRRERGAGAPHVIPIDEVQAPPDNPRLKMFQTETLSINWVEYHGARDRSQLSPHSHADFEQGSLAIAGNFIHHLRTPWGRNADLWREDLHLEAGSPSMISIPLHMIHTTEGVGSGHHLLVDVFSPPRADFIAKGWVLNASDYLHAPAPMSSPSEA